MSSISFVGNWPTLTDVGFLTDDEDRDIYDVDSEGDPSDDPVGKLVGKTGRAKWF